MRQTPFVSDPAVPVRPSRRDARAPALALALTLTLAMCDPARRAGQPGGAVADAAGAGSPRGAGAARRPGASPATILTVIGRQP